MTEVSKNSLRIKYGLTKSWFNTTADLGTMYRKSICQWRSVSGGISYVSLSVTCLTCSVAIWARPEKTCLSNLQMTDLRDVAHMINDRLELQRPQQARTLD